MAVIGTIGGVALRPGVSKNRRRYTSENVSRAAAQMQARIASPDGLPLTMRTHHAAGDDSTRIAGHLTTVTVDSDGVLSYEAALNSTSAGREMLAAIEDASLRTVSIRGAWEGDVRQVRGDDGGMVTVGEGLVIDGVDFTATPGVSGTSVAVLTRTAGESVAPERMILEDAPITVGPPPAAREALDQLHAALGEAHVSLGGWTGPADVEISAYGVSNDDLGALAAKIAAAFAAAITNLDPDDDDDVDLPDGVVLQSADPSPQALTESANPHTTEAPVPEQTTPKAAAESAPVTETTPAPAAAVDEAAIVDRVVEAVVARLAPAKPADTTATESAAVQVSEAAITEAVTAQVAAALDGVTEAAKAAVAKATDGIRADLVAGGVIPRKGLMETAEAKPEKPLHEMSREERNTFYSERFDLIANGGRPMAAVRA